MLDKQYPTIHSNGLNKDGNTPLHLAYNFGNIPVIKLLLVCGADINAKNAFGKVPSYYETNKTNFDFKF